MNILKSKQEALNKPNEIQISDETNNVNEKINQLTNINKDLEYWQNKVLESEIKNARESLEYSKKLEENKLKLERMLTANANLKNKIKDAEESIINTQKYIVQNKENNSEICKHIPILEENNIKAYTEVNSIFLFSVCTKISVHQFFE